jgi:hypothetical protein
VSSLVFRWLRPTPTNSRSSPNLSNHLRDRRRRPQLPLSQNQRRVGWWGVELLAPYSSTKRDPAPRRSTLLSRFRYRIDTVFSQLVGRYSIKGVWARDLWHLMNRLLRKILSHTVAFLLNHPNRQSTPTTLEATHLKNLQIGLASIQGCPGFLAGAGHAREATEDLPVLDIPLGELRRIIAFLSVGSTIVSGTGIKPTLEGGHPSLRFLRG